MKLLRSAIAVLALVVIVTCFAGASFAAEKGQFHKDWQGSCQAKIKSLRDSAAILQKSNPDLVKGLTDLADQKEKKLNEIMDMKAKHEAKAKMLRDSAAVLQKTNPNLAKELWDMSECQYAGKMGRGKKECPMGMMGHKEADEEHEEVEE